MPRKRALLIKFGAIGDVVMVISSARALYEAGYDVDWACGRAVLPLLETYSWIRPFAVDDRAILRGAAGERMRAIVGFWGRVARVHYDLCATLYYDRRYDLLTWPVRAARKLKLSRATRTMQLLPGRNHTNEFVRVVMGWEDSCREESVPPARPDRLPPSPLPMRSKSRRIALVPGGASNMVRQQILRRWPLESYVELTRRLLARGWEVVLLGGPDDAWVRPSFAGLEIVDAIGGLTLPEVVSVCDTCDGVVSHDTGPLHLAGLSAAALLGLFGPTDPSIFLPRRPYAVGLWGGQGFACRPCHDGTDFAPCKFNGCMHQITVERALEELDRLLAESAAGVESSWRVTEPDAQRLVLIS